jgi:hypothetical protein
MVATIVNNKALAAGFISGDRMIGVKNQDAATPMRTCQLSGKNRMKKKIYPG